MPNSRPYRPSGRPKPSPSARPSREGGRPTRRPRRGGKQAERPAAEPGAGVRLQRVMAEAGVASRRECEQMIEDGRVAVNGEVVSRLPVFVDPMSDRIAVDGQLLPRPERTVKRVYVMLNKPDNTLGTTKDDLAYEKGGRRTVNDLVTHPSGARLYPVGRLDFHTTGLVLMTNDGVLADRLTHARYGVTKTYRVWINGRMPEEIMEMLRRRVGKRESPNGGVRTVGDEVDRDQHHRPQTREANTSVLDIEVREGKTPPLDEVLTGCGCRVKRIARTALGPLRLMGVRPGDWRDLTKDELATLKEAAGLTGPGAPESGKSREGRPPTGKRAEGAP